MTFKVLIVLSLTIVTIVVACGGGGGSRMTVEEYAAACEGLGDKLDDFGGGDEDLSFGFDAIEDAIAEIKRWNPPEELQEFHEVRVRSLDAAIDALKDTGFYELMEDLEKASQEEDSDKVLELMGEMSELEDEMLELEDEMSELEDDMERTEEDLSPATRAILADAGCL